MAKVFTKSGPYCQDQSLYEEYLRREFGETRARELIGGYRRAKRGGSTGPLLTGRDLKKIRLINIEQDECLESQK